jgi:hypothetical protein
VLISKTFPSFALSLREMDYKVIDKDIPKSFDATIF